jgi:hypothetical protein
MRTCATPPSESEAIIVREGLNVKRRGVLPAPQGAVSSSRPRGVCAVARLRAASATTSAMCARGFFDEITLQQLAQDLQDVAAALRQFLQTEHPVVRQRHLARQRHRPTPLFVNKCPPPDHARVRESKLPREPNGVFYKTAADPIDIRDGMMGRRDTDGWAPSACQYWSGRPSEGVVWC